MHRCACLAENPATCAWNARANVARRRVLAVANLFARTRWSYVEFFDTGVADVTTSSSTN